MAKFLRDAAEIVCSPVEWAFIPSGGGGCQLVSKGYYNRRSIFKVSVLIKVDIMIALETNRFRCLSNVLCSKALQMSREYSLLSSSEACGLGKKIQVHGWLKLSWVWIWGGGIARPFLYRRWYMEGLPISAHSSPTLLSNVRTIRKATFTDRQSDSRWLAKRLVVSKRQLTKIGGLIEVWTSLLVERIWESPSKNSNCDRMPGDHTVIYWRTESTDCC